jgi:hypothetical protein
MRVKEASVADKVDKADLERDVKSGRLLGEQPAELSAFLRLITFLHL